MSDIKIIITGIAVFIGIVVGVIFIGNIANRSQCANNVTEMGRGYRYDFINGCRIQQNDGTFIYWKMYRVTNEE